MEELLPKTCQGEKQPDLNSDSRAITEVHDAVGITERSREVLVDLQAVFTHFYTQSTGICLLYKYIEA